VYRKRRSGGKYLALKQSSQKERAIADSGVQRFT
jgi:hypothetical protein